MATSRLRVPPVEHDRRGGLARVRSAALRDGLLELPEHDAAATVLADGPAYIAGLLGRDWLMVVDHVRDANGSVPAGVAWRAAYGLQHLGHAGDAAAVLRDAATDDASAADLSRLAGVDASVRWTRGDEAGCRTRAEEALAQAGIADDVSAEAAAWVVQALLAASTGDRDANLRCYQRGLLLAERAGDLLTVERILNNLGARELEEGRYAEAAEELHRGLEVNERTGHLSGLAVLLHNVAEALFGLGRLDEALVECDGARDLWTAIEAPSAGVSWHLRGQIQTARGNAAQAAMSYRHSAALAAAEDDVQTRAMALVGHAAASVGSDVAEAVALAEQALQLPIPVGHALPVAAAGWVHLAAGDSVRAAALARDALEIAARHRDLPTTADALELAVMAGQHTGEDPRLREAAAIWQTLGARRRLLINDVLTARLARDRVAASIAHAELRSLGIHEDAWHIAGPLREAGMARSSPVSVRVLGAFALVVDGTAVPLSVWPSRKARDVLRVLAVHGEEGIARARLGALVWPDAEAVGNRLSVALSHVRAVLDPGRTQGPDHFVRADRERVRLDLDHLDVDVVDARRAARRALDAARTGDARAVHLLEAAAAMYSGEVCEDDPYAEWARPAREELDVLGRDVIRTLSETLIARGSLREALPWLARLLADDPYDEPASTAVVGLLHRLGRYGEARRHHRSYVLRTAELGVPALTLAQMTGMAGA